ncbi:MAG: sensor histidine kinase [Flavobacteriales bacterium]|nr:sensor histidine kinase [Flavobacteriales bacterium]MBL6873024.1 sensor histidine kinase [Flavobacteriales bacterium]
MIKFNNPKTISFYSSLLLAILTSLLFLLITYARGNFDLTNPIIIFLLVLGLCYFTNNLILTNFISEKVKVIYKTILSQKGISEKIETDLEKVNNDVFIFLNRNKSELDELKKMETFRREFIGNISHELKTPVFNMQGFIHTLIDGAIYDDNVNIKYLDRASKSIDRMITMLNDLDVITSIESNNYSIDFSDWNLNLLIEEIIGQLEIKTKSKNISISLDYENKSQTLVHADRDLIHHVITNLLVNSINYGNLNGKTEVRLFDMGDSILIEVADNGIGISQKHLPRLFERFYRVDKSRSRKDGGSGLGLSIVKHIIESHGQTINVRSTEGVGTTFGFTLKKSEI